MDSRTCLDQIQWPPTNVPLVPSRVTINMLVDKHTSLHSTVIVSSRKCNLRNETFYMRDNTA